MSGREGAQGHRRHKRPASQEGLRVTRRRAGVAGGRDTLVGVVPAERREPHTTAVVFYRQASGPDRANGPSARRVEPQRAPTANILGLIEFVPMVALTPRPGSSSNLCANENTAADQAFGVNKGAAPGKFVRPAEKMPGDSGNPISCLCTRLRLSACCEPRTNPARFGARGYAPSELSWNSSSASCSASALFLAGSSCGSGRQGLIS